MGLRVKGEAAAATDDGGEGDEETDEEFAERVYLALMRVARSASARVQNAMGACVMLGTAYSSAPEVVRATIREFIEAAEL